MPEQLLVIQIIYPLSAEFHKLLLPLHELRAFLLPLRGLHCAEAENWAVQTSLLSIP